MRRRKPPVGEALNMPGVLAVRHPAVPADMLGEYGECLPVWHIFPFYRARDTLVVGHPIPTTVTIDKPCDILVYTFAGVADVRCGTVIEDQTMILASVWSPALLVAPGRHNPRNGHYAADHPSVRLSDPDIPGKKNSSNDGEERLDRNPSAQLYRAERRQSAPVRPGQVYRDQLSTLDDLPGYTGGFV